MSARTGSLARLLTLRNLRGERFGAIAAILGVAVGAATVNVVAILDTNTTRIEQQFAATTRSAEKKANTTLTLVPVRDGKRIEPTEPKGPTREDHEVLRDGIRGGSLLAFALGALIVFFTFSAIMDRRRREVALLRSLGASKVQVSALFVQEAALIGALGGALGFVAAIPTAYLAAGAGVTTTGHLKIDPQSMTFPWGWMALLTTLSATLSVVGALYPIRAALRLSIPRALLPRSLDPQSTLAKHPSSRPWRILLFGLLALAYPLLRPLLQRSLPLLSFHLLEAVALLLGFLCALLLVPSLVGALGAPLLRVIPGGSAAERLLTRRRFEHRGHELSLSVSFVMVVCSLLLTLHMVTAALKREVVVWARAALNDETFVLPWYPKLRADTLTVTLPPSAKVLYLSGRTPWPNALHAARAADLAMLADEHGRPDQALIARRLGPGKILLSTLMARRFQLQEGDALDVLGPAGPRRLTVVGVTDGLGFTPMNASHRRARTYGVIDEADQDLIAPWADPIGTVAVVAHAGDAEITKWRGAPARDLITKRGIYLMPARFYEDLRLREANSDFLIFDLLLVLTSVLAGVGIGNQLLLSVRAREGELSLYRMLGMRVNELRRLVLLEGALVGVLGGCLASLLAIPLGFSATSALSALTGFNVRFELPLAYVVATLLFATLIATLASLYPAQRAAAREASEPVRAF